MSRPDQLVLVAVVFAAGVAAGTAISAEAGGPASEGAGGGPVWALTTLLLVAASVHVINEWADADTDAMTRRTRFSGGSGALTELGVARHVALVAAVSLAGSGVVSALVGWSLGTLPTSALALLAVGLVGGWLYSVGPFAFSRHGWGEVANAALGGLALPAYGMAVAGGAVSTSDVVVFAPFALLVFVNLLETQWPDRDADRSVGKHTLASRLSPRAVRALATAVVAGAYVLVVAMAPEPLPRVVALASLSALPLSVWGLVRLTRSREPLPGVLAMVVMIVAQGLAWNG